MDSDPVFAAFIQQRQSLNARLDSARAEVDAWFAEHERTHPADLDLRDLFVLEALIGERQHLFAEFIALHEDFVSKAIQSRRSNE